MAGSSSLPLARERRLILILLLALAAAAWALLVWQSRMMTAMAMGPTMGLAVPLFLAIWIAMMVAMMFPSAAPMVLMYTAIARGKRQRAQAFVPTWIFVAGYLIIWALAGLAAFLLATGAAWLAGRSLWVMAHAGQVSGALLVAAGIYQLTPLKRVCLSKCRTPLAFVMSGWREGAGGALRMGLEHGAICLGCCWLLFAILFPLGIMNIVAMLLLTALIFAEKALPWGERAARQAGWALIAYGLAVVVAPSLLPGASM